MKNKLMLVLTLVHAAAFTVAIALMTQDIVPIHWGPTGIADNYGSKWTMLLFAFIPFLLQLGKNYYRTRTRENTAARKNEKLEDRTITAITILFITISWGVYAITSANMLDIGGVFPGVLSMLLGLLMMYISNYLPTIKQNRWYGIKVYWTLNDEEVWKRTHRFGAYTGVAGSFFMIIGGAIAIALNAPLIALYAVFAGVFGICVIPTIYAGIYYRKLHPKQ